MLTVAPSGATNDVILLLTLPRSSTQSRVTGSVIDEDDVENAVISAGDIALNHLIGLTPPMNFNISGSTTTAWNRRPPAIITM
jgi:hypothetical protein